MLCNLFNSYQSIQNTTNVFKFQINNIFKNQIVYTINVIYTLFACILYAIYRKNTIRFKIN